MTNPSTRTRDEMIDEEKRGELVYALRKVQQLLWRCEINDGDPLAILDDCVEDALRFLRKIRSMAHE